MLGFGILLNEYLNFIDFLIVLVVFVVDVIIDGWIEKNKMICYLFFNCRFNLN